jgi:hypothetical protein
VRRYEAWGVDGDLTFRDPALCDVCFVFFDIPGDVSDAFYEAGVEIQDAVEEPMEGVFAAKWREKVADGRRAPQGDGERAIHWPTLG